MTDDIRTFLEIKQKELEFHQHKVVEVRREIAEAQSFQERIHSALRKQQTITRKRKRAPLDEMYRERSALVFPILRQFGGEMHIYELSRRTGIKASTLRDWMNKQILLRPACPWKNGRNQMYFQLREGFDVQPSHQESPAFTSQATPDPQRAFAAPKRLRRNANQLFQERSAKIVPFLQHGNQEGEHVKDIAKLLDLKPTTAQSWVWEQMELRPDCPWTTGRMRCLIKLRVSSPQPNYGRVPENTYALSSPSF